MCLAIQVGIRGLDNSQDNDMLVPLVKDAVIFFSLFVTLTYLYCNMQALQSWTGKVAHVLVPRKGQIKNLLYPLKINNPLKITTFEPVEPQKQKLSN